jgi:hypothetical protein
MARWSVDVVGKRLQHLGTVVAANEQTAGEEAIKQFRGKTCPAEQDRGDQDRRQRLIICARRRAS